MISLEFLKGQAATAGAATSLSGLTTHRQRRIYDHRIKAQIIAAGDPTLFPELEIPRSTAVGVRA